VTFESAGIFRYTTASLPAFLVTGVTHAVLTLIWVRPAGKGGYPTTSELASATLEETV
jgi:NCS1 family nucleobase:cation symporter-1